MGKIHRETLAREALDHSGREGTIEAHVWTESDNTRAIGPYQHIGFAERALLLELALQPDDRHPGMKQRNRRSAGSSNRS